MRNLQWGATGDDVKVVQQKLQDLGYYRGALDGRFGAGTRQAVMNFQRDNRLRADGIVGPLTYAALGVDATGSPAVPPGQAATGKTRKIALHIGVNNVDPAKYAGWDGRLNGCENDSDTMKSIAEIEGYEITQLKSAAATTGNILAAIQSAADNLAAGDTFLLTYAGHGGQVPNTGTDIETDAQDETWVLYDRMLIDDELEAAFTKFRAGVNIILLSDSCHSGTVYRNLFIPEQLEIASRKALFYQHLSVSRSLDVFTFPQPAQDREKSHDGNTSDHEQQSLFTRALQMSDSDSSKRGTAFRSATRTLTKVKRVPSLAERFGNTASNSRNTSDGNADQVVTRNMPIGINALVVQEQADTYAAIQAEVRSRGQVVANGVLIAGCMDNQLSQEVAGKGVFTTAVKSVWANNTFTGDFDAFHKSILPRMGANQTPELSAFGASPEVLLRSTPF